jgi:hypothetical protein
MFNGKLDLFSRKEALNDLELPYPETSKLLVGSCWCPTAEGKETGKARSADSSSASKHKKPVQQTVPRLPNTKTRSFSSCKADGNRGLVIKNDQSIDH